MSNSPERAVKSNIPWSVKGIERDARETAKGAAKREGMTVGEWLNKVIYTAGNPEISNGEIEGIKFTDLITAIEHLSRRITTTETSGAKAVDDLARNVGGVVERVQRLERVKSNPADLENRIEHLESKSTDRQRIDALKALEKAVGHVALQFDTSHRAALERIEATETQLRDITTKVEQGSITDPETSASAVDFLKDAVDGMSARISRVERIASEASRLTNDAAEEVDPEFIEQTGQRLRILGDEIKRGGDHIRKLEIIIGKMASQIDAAERRSSEGVQQVAETISEMREHFTSTDTTDTEENRRQIEKAISAISTRTDDRITKLQSSFDQMISRLENVGAAARASISNETPNTPETSNQVPSVDDTIVNPLSALNFEENTPASNISDTDTELKIDLDQNETDFDFLENVPPENASEQTSDKTGEESTGDLLAQINEAHPFSTQEDGFTYDNEDELGNLLDDDEDHPSTFGQNVEDELSPNDLVEDETEATKVKEPEKPVDYLKAARLKAKQAAEEKAAADATKKKKLSPKQRAILAAKIRRKKAAAKAALDESNQEDSENESTENSASQNLTASFLAKVSTRLPKAKSKKSAVEEADGNERLTSGRRTVNKKSSLADVILARPITAALGAAIILVTIALFVLMKDTMFSDAQTDQPAFTATPDSTGASTLAPTTASPTDTAKINQPTDADDRFAAQTTTDQPTTAPLIRPRDLYIQSVSALRLAESESDITNAMKGIEEAAALGHPPAQLQLGEVYRSGLGVDKDLDLARSWYQRAAEGGNVLAMHRLGVMYARGDGGNVDNTSSVTWFEKAANLGLVDSQYNLGATYHPTGDGNPVHDRAKAYFWYQIAARNGDQQAGGLASGLGASMTAEARAKVDGDIAVWQASIPDPVANENISA